MAIDKLAYVISRYLNIFAFHFKVKIDLQVTMPHSYPYVALQMFARSPELDRQQQLLLSKSWRRGEGGTAEAEETAFAETKQFGLG